MLRHTERTAQMFKALRNMGKSVFIITHDSELTEKCCTCEINLSDHKAALYAL